MKALLIVLDLYIKKERRDSMQNKTTMLVVSLIFSVFVLLTACQKANPMDSAQAYIDAWSALDYEKMYDSLSVDSQESISKDKFVERYETIFSAIELNKIELSPQELVQEEDKAFLPLDVVFHTDTVDSFEAHFTLPLVLEENEWKVVWTPSLIFPDLGSDDQVRLVSQHAVRGDITDRNGNPIAIEGEAYTVGAVPGKIPDKQEFAKALAPLLEMEEEKILDELSKDWVKDDTLVPLRNLPLNISQDFKDKILSVKGVMLATNVVTDSRRYLDNELYSHVVGYVQRVSAEDLEKNQGYSPQDLIGKQGIEAAFEDQLHGSPGYTLFIRDKDNNTKSVIAERSPKNGNTVSLTLDPKLQEIAYKALKGHVGTIVALDGKTGEVLAMVSYPDYDPNIFPNGVLPSKWKELSEHPDNPFINRASYALYPPGSTLKPFSAVMALEEGIISEDTVVKEAEKSSWTPPIDDWNGPPITRTNHPAGPVNLDRALVWSDNIYFAWAALKMPYESFESYAQNLGIGEPLPFALPVSQSTIKNENTPWSKRLLAVSSIGQGEILITPLQLGAMYTAFLNQGDIVLPQLIQQIKTPDGQIIEEFERKVWKPKAIPEKWIDVILPSLINVVEDKTGTAHRLAMDGLTIAAKTGTAQKDDEGQKEIGWLVAFTPEESNPLILTIALEVAAGEGGVKLDMAKEIFEAYYMK